MTKRNFSRLFARVIWVGKRHGKRIEKYSRGLFKRDAMFAQICFGFLWVPLINHRNSLTQKTNRKLISDTKTLAKGS